MTRSCDARHWFGTDPVGVGSYCTLPAGHLDEHIDKEGRWWRTSLPRRDSEPRICEVLVPATQCPGRGLRVPVYAFFSHPNRTIHDPGDEDEGRTELYHLLDPGDPIARGFKVRGLTAGRSACGFLYPRRMVTRVRHLVDCPACKALMGER